MDLISQTYDVDTNLTTSTFIKKAEEETEENMDEVPLTEEEIELGKKLLKAQEAVEVLIDKLHLLQDINDTYRQIITIQKWSKEAQQGQLDGINMFIETLEKLLEHKTKESLAH